MCVSVIIHCLHLPVSTLYVTLMIMRLIDTNSMMAANPIATPTLSLMRIPKRFGVFVHLVALVFRAKNGLCPPQKSSSGKEKNALPRHERSRRIFISEPCSQKSRLVVEDDMDAQLPAPTVPAPTVPAPVATATAAEAAVVATTAPVEGEGEGEGDEEGKEEKETEGGDATSATTTTSSSAAAAAASITTTTTTATAPDATADPTKVGVRHHCGSVCVGI